MLRLGGAYNDKNLSFVDVSLVVLAYDFVVITFDKKLAAKLKSK